MEWYYVIRGQQCGPVSEDELSRLARMGELQRTDLVWNETLERHWLEAGTFPQFFASPPGLPPPLPSVPQLPPPLAPPSLDHPAFEEHPTYGTVSLSAPVGLAWDRMKALLFAPFDMGKWFVLGFTAWLATLRLGGIVPSFKFGDFSNHPVEMAQKGDWWQFLVTNMAVMIVGALVALALALGIGLILAWVRARGEFIFLENVLRNETRVAEPWRRWGRQGNSLFWWRFAFGLLCAVVFTVIGVAFVLAILLPCLHANAFLSATVPALVGVSLALLTCMLVAGYISLFLRDFVVPLMLQNGVGAVQGWRLFMELTRGHVGKFMLYGIFHFMLTVVAGTAVLLIVILTCCLAGCLLLIPYVGTVALLPMLVFLRLYSLEYMAQYGVQYDLLRTPPESGDASAQPHP